MKVHVKILDLPNLAAIFGKAEMHVDFEGRTVNDFLRTLKDRFGPNLSQVLWDRNGKWDQSIQMIINGRFYIKEGQPVELSAGDQISFMVFLEGG